MNFRLLAKGCERGKVTMNVEHREMIVAKVMPALVVFSLWLDGSFYPILLLPFLYVLTVEKRDLGFLGFKVRGFNSSIGLGFVVAGVVFALYLPLFFFYRIPTQDGVNLYDIFTDAIWYPIYEETTYRAFFLAHFGAPVLSSSHRGVLPNLIQALLFLSVHHKYLAMGEPLVLIPVFLLGFLNGLVFLKTSNVLGCVFSHSLANGAALLLRALAV